MNKSQAQSRVKKLRDEINHHRFLYHVKDTQEISDAALDSLKDELEKIEQQYPELVTPDSPTQRVGGKPLPQFEQVDHQSRMLSLQDAFSVDELTQWEVRNKKIVNSAYKYFVELKIDGVAVSLIYQDGQLITAATRGDGHTGENVTQNMKTIEAIPLSLRQPVPGRVEIRGEVYLTKTDFNKLNKERVKKNEPLYANPRNIAAGSIRQLDPSIAAKRPLRFFAWEITAGVESKTRQQEYDKLQELGFAVPPDANLYKNIEEISKFLVKEEEVRNNRAFLVDGAVIKINDLSVSKRLGIVGKAPRGSIAFKFAAEESTTVVEDIVIQVGRTGALTPVAHLRPVVVAGSRVSRATLHNADEIKRKDVRIGDTVIIRKAGDIIPEVVQVLPKLRPKSSQPYKFTTSCPVCKSPVTQSDDGAVARCSNSNCFPVQSQKIIHAVSSQAFDIDGLGDAIIEQLLSEGLIKDPADLWQLQAGDLTPLERFAEKSAQNLVSEIQNKKEIRFDRFLVALSIPGVGVITAIDLAKHFESLKQLQKASIYSLEAIEGIGEKVAPAIHDFLTDPQTEKLVKKYMDAGIKITNSRQTGSLSGKSFIFTGSLPNMSRDEAKSKVQSLGGSIASTVGKQVDFLVAGEKGGSKLAKAKELGVKVISPQQFMQMLN